MGVMDIERHYTRQACLPGLQAQAASWRAWGRFSLPAPIDYRETFTMAAERLLSWPPVSTVLIATYQLPVGTLVTVADCALPFVTLTLLV